jgi:hypothetical protein
MTLPVLGQTGASGQTAPCEVTPAKRQPQPYTAEFKITHVQTLSNGTTITSESTRVQALDSQGRSMSTTTSIQPYGDRTPTTSAFSQDPVAGTHTTWTSLTKKASIVKLPPEDRRHGCWQSPSGHFRISYPAARPSGTAAQSDASKKVPATAAARTVTRPVSEVLGTMTIQGVEARGQRWTTTTPVGEIGNDQPLVSTQETWTAPRLGTVRRVSDDPRMGKDTDELVKLDQGEPDPALFQPPEGYEVVAEEMVPCKE